MERKGNEIRKVGITEDKEYLLTHGELNIFILVYREKPLETGKNRNVLHY